MKTTTLIGLMIFAGTSAMASSASATNTSATSTATHATTNVSPSDQVVCQAYCDVRVYTQQNLDEIKQTGGTYLSNCQLGDGNFQSTGETAAIGFEGLKAQCNEVAAQTKRNAENCGYPIVDMRKRLKNKYYDQATPENACN